MMDPQQAYDRWSEQYDTNTNRTRDMEGQVLQAVLNDIRSTRVLEIGCGTGKNTAWLLARSQHITAVDLSQGMLDKARGKIRSPKVRFVQADIRHPWTFREAPYDLVTFSLVLEHVEHVAPLVMETAASLASGGHLYIGELHPFKQYAGTKARFDAPDGRQEVTCHVHHVSDFLEAGRACGLVLAHAGEHFDDGDRSSGPPRILSLLFRKP